MYIILKEPYLFKDWFAHPETPQLIMVKDIYDEQFGYIVKADGPNADRTRADDYSGDPQTQIIFCHPDMPSSVSGRYKGYIYLSERECTEITGAKNGDFESLMLNWEEFQ